RGLALHFRDLTHDQELGTVEHPLFAEGQALLAAEGSESLQDQRDLVDAPGPHLVRILLEPALPVGVLLDLTVAQHGEDLLDVTHADDVTKADPVGVLLGHPDSRIVRQDPELVKTDLPRRRGTRLNALDDPDSVVWVDDLLTDLEIQSGPLFQLFGTA